MASENPAEGCQTPPKAVHSLQSGCRARITKIWPHFADSAAGVGGELSAVGILLRPFPLSRCNPYTSAIIIRFSGAYEGFHSWATVSIVSLIRCSYAQNSIIGATDLRSEFPSGFVLPAPIIEVLINRGADKKPAVLFAFDAATF